MLKLGVIFGGISTEHDVSCISGTSVIENLDKSKYEIYPIYISKDGKWYKYTKEISKIYTLQIEQEIQEKEEIIDVIRIFKKIRSNISCVTWIRRRRWKRTRLT